MCGICGYVTLDGSPVEEEGVLQRMAQQITHRGPDATGVHHDAAVGLANCRLSIIDVAGGDQPVYNEDRSICVVFNGEIYNHGELRAELEQQGHRLASRADTEVLVHLYEEHGDRFVERLNGMFAFALWDASRQRLLLGRDRLGIKPLYVARASGQLLFGSEIKALLAHPGLTAVPDLQGIDEFITLRYLGGSSSILQGVEKVLPGTTVVVEGGATSERLYWSPSVAPDGRGDDADQVRELLEDSVRLRLMSDVPFGSFLSGGLDSSGIVALMQRHMDTPVQTFSIGFPEQAHLDERQHARAVAEHVGADHHEVECTADQVERLPSLLWHFDEPFADPIIVPTHQVSEFARQHVKVILTGEGADELFGGYTRFVVDSNLRRWGAAGGLALGLGSRLLPSAAMRAQCRRLADLRRAPQADRFLAWVAAFQDDERRRLYGPELSGQLDSRPARSLYDDVASQAPDATPLGRMLWCELKIRLPECMLARTDRMTMAVSLEGRTPFLDHRLVEHVLRLPDSDKVKGRQEKRILKQALASVLPASIPRRRKQGLAVPFALWTKHGLGDAIRRILSPERIRQRGLFATDHVSELLGHWGPHAGRHSQMIWSLLCLELWFRLYVDSDERRITRDTPLSEVA